MRLNTDKIKSLRDGKKIGNLTLCAMIDICPPYFHRLMHHGDFPEDIAQAIADLFGVPIKELEE